MDVSDFIIPDRFERLRGVSDEALQTIISPVKGSLEVIDRRFVDMPSSGRGSMLIMRGRPGIGKSTFLDTVRLFRHNVETVRVPQAADVAAALAGLEPSKTSRILVLEGREALGVVSQEQVEGWMHAINTFVRSDAGQRTLVVWPVNKPELGDLLAAIGKEVGDDALFGTGAPIHEFGGLDAKDFPRVAERTVAALNDGLSVTSLGVSEEQMDNLVADSPTIGAYLGKVRGAALDAQGVVSGLMTRESYRVWTIVVSGTDSEGDVAALTRGSQSYVDIDRLMGATNANVVADLQAQPAVVGILGTTLDARVIHLDMLTALAVARTYGSDGLHALMRAEGMTTRKDPQAKGRLLGSELGLLLSGAALGPRRRGSKPGDNTKAAFGKIAAIARTNDGLLNASIGHALVDAGLVSSYSTEESLGTELVYFSDVYCAHGDGPIRLEVMWRAETGRAAIANYVLGKLRNYGKAIGLVR